MQNIIQLPGYMNELGNIVMIKFKILQLEKMLNILQVAGDQVIHADHTISFTNKPIAKMRS